MGVWIITHRFKNVITKYYKGETILYFEILGIGGELL
jgi:hypothetical protein